MHYLKPWQQKHRSEPIINDGMRFKLCALSPHLIGGLMGFLLQYLTTFGEATSRSMAIAIAIETSMKSSTFGFLLSNFLCWRLF